MISELTSQVLKIPEKILSVFNKKYTLDFPNIGNKLNKIAIPAIALFALSSLDAVWAGPLEYAACVTACTFTCTPAAFPACATGCLLFLPIPGP